MDVGFMVRFGRFGTEVRIPGASGPKRVSGGTQDRISGGQPFQVIEVVR